MLSPKPKCSLPSQPPKGSSELTVFSMKKSFCVFKIASFRFWYPVLFWKNKYCIYKCEKSLWCRSVPAGRFQTIIKIRFLHDEVFRPRMCSKMLRRRGDDSNRRFFPSKTSLASALLDFKWLISDDSSTMRHQCLGIAKPSNEWFLKFGSRHL